LPIGPVNSALDRAESAGAGTDHVNAIGGQRVRVDDTVATRYLAIVGQSAIS